jgi:hypothetical protein
MQIYEVDQTLSYTGSGASTVRELTLPGNVSFQGLMFRFDGYATGATGNLEDGFNSLKIQVSGQSPVQEVANITELSDITDVYTGLLVDRSVSQDIANYADAGAVDLTNGNWFILPWSHSNNAPIKIVLDLDLAGAIFGTTSSVTVTIGLINPNTPVSTTFVLTKESMSGSSTTENVNLPAWGADEMVAVMGAANQVTRIAAPALGVSIDHPALYGPNWQFTTHQGADTDGFTHYLLERALTPTTGSDTLNFTKASADTAGDVYFLKMVPCAGGAR